MTRLRLGIDLGGTKMAGIVLDGGGQVRAETRRPTPRHDYAGTVSAMRDLVAELETAAGGTASIGIGMPGALSTATGLVKNANSTWLNGRPFDRDLVAALGRPVRLENDANCFALSEARDGAAEGRSVVFGAILGTGIGGGVVVHGRVLRGAHAIAGEWGHLPLPWAGPDDGPAPLCWCGRHGCLEAWCSGPALEDHYAARSGQAMRADAIAQRARQGDAMAADHLEAHASRLARGLALIVNLIDPDMIVLGGGLSNLPGLAEALEGAVPRWTFSDATATPVRRARHGDASGVRGAAWLWP